MMVLRKLLVLLLAFQCYAVRIPTVGYEQRQPAAPQFFAYVPSTLAAYELPNHAMVHFQFPLSTYDGYLAKTFITITLGTVEAATPSQNAVALGWTPFVPFLFKWSVARWNVFTNSNRRAGPHPMLLPVNNWVPADVPPPATTLLNMCHVEAGTDESGKSLLSVLKGILGRDAATAAPVGAPCWYQQGQWVTMWIPTRFLTPLPVFPDVRVSMTLSMLDHDWDRLRNQAGHLSLVVSAAVPYTTTAPEVQLSSLIFHRFVPSSTIHGVQLTSIRVSFTPGVNVLAGGVVALMVQAPIFQDIPVAVGLTLAPIVIGYGNCAAEPTSPFCCFASYGFSRVSNGLFGYDSSQSDSNELHTGGFSTLSIVLGPQGCILPADKLIVFSIPQSYLGSNPSLIDASGPMSYSYAYRVLNVKIATSTEPEFVFLDLYTGSDGPFYTSMQDSYKDISSDGNNRAHAFAPFRYGMDSFNIVVIGTSTVNSFLIAVDTLTTDMTPSWIRFTFSLSTDWVFPNTGTPPEMPHTPQRILIAAAKVFKPNQGTIELPLQLGNGAFQPSACTTVTFFTNSHSSLFVTPNSQWSVACNDAMNSGAVVSFTLPGTILLPNPSAGTIVTFNIRLIPSYTVPDYVDSDINSDGVTIANSVDGATLLDVFGYQTVAVCGVIPYASGRVFDLAALQTVDRCVLVAALTTLSPTSAGILQCPTGGGLITYVKVPESMWTTPHWPQTNLASLGNWAQVVSLAPSSPLAYILSYGNMITYPMFAVVVSYPPTVSALQMLGVNPNVPAGWTIAFIVRLDRLTLACQIANNNNPWRLQVYTTQNVVEVLLFVDHLALGAAGTPLLQVPGSAWGYSNGIVFVTAAHGGVVVGFATVLVSPVPNTDDSDDALFGLLALIAVPILLLCCLAALLWFLRPKAEPCPGCPEYPVQEMYWVNAQPAAPVYMVEPAAQAMMSAPPTTPIYLVQ